VLASNSEGKRSSYSFAFVTVFDIDNNMGGLKGGLRGLKGLRGLRNLRRGRVRSSYSFVFVTVYICTFFKNNCIKSKTI
jgi:hypothetical protein